MTEEQGATDKANASALDEAKALRAETSARRAISRTVVSS